MMRSHCRTIATCVVIAAMLGLTPNVTRSQVVGDTSTTLFNVAGIDVIHRRLPASELVVAQIYLLGGSRQLTFQDAGIEAVMLQAAAHGTRKYPGDAAGVALARTGASVLMNTNRDWSLVELRTLRSDLDSAWSVIADRFVAPELSSGAVSLVRDRMYMQHQAMVNDPDELLQYFADSITFLGHPYGIDPNGNERSLRLMRSTDVWEYHKAQTVTSRMLVVFVGNVTRAEIERLITPTLGTLPRGAYTWTLPPEIPKRKSGIVMIPRTLKTNYIIGLFPGPPVGSRDNAAFRVSTELLGGYFNYVIREEEQLSYAATSTFANRAIASGGIYASTNQPAKVLTKLQPLMAAVLEEGMEWRHLPRLLNQYSLEFLLSQETFDGQADELARSHLLRGDLRTNAWFVELKKVSPISMQLMARKYFPHIQYIYLGDIEAIRSVLKK